MCVNRYIYIYIYLFKRYPKLTAQILIGKRMRGENALTIVLCIQIAYSNTSSNVHPHFHHLRGTNNNIIKWKWDILNIFMLSVAGLRGGGSMPQTHLNFLFVVIYTAQIKDLQNVGL